VKRVYVAGHLGMVGSALVRLLAKREDVTVITRTRAQLDLTNQLAVDTFFAEEHIDEVYLAAAKVGGIHANSTYPGDFIYVNLAIQCNVIQAAHKTGVHKLLFLGSSCIYPKLAKQPMHESELLTGTLEPTNEPYAVAKIAGIKLCEGFNRQFGRDYRSVMPTNLYGPHDNFHAENSHVIPGLLRRFHEAKLNGETSVTAWGTGAPRREFMHVEDMASASVHVMELEQTTYNQVTSPTCSHINIGTGVDCSIRELVETVADVTSYSGQIAWDTQKPDGAPQKLLDVHRLRSMGWTHQYSLSEGLEDAYRWFVSNQTSFRS
jgi:GDP-L-fucose synthase